MDSIEDTWAAQICGTQLTGLPLSLLSSHCLGKSIGMDIGPSIQASHLQHDQKQVATEEYKKYLFASM